MATCPRCGGYLGDRHRCHGAWRRVRAATIAVCLGSAIGVILALAVSVLIPGYDGTVLSGPTLFLVGALAGMSVWWLSTGRGTHL